ncbi:hypothetical protein AVEN_136085-1, partial [Araneus ventricosus]
MVGCRPPGRRDPGSKSDSSEDQPRMGHASRYTFIQSAPRHRKAVQKYEEDTNFKSSAEAASAFHSNAYSNSYYSFPISA